jgi:hypothetical protein
MDKSISYSLLCLILIAVFTGLIFLQGEFGPLFNN